MASWYPTKDLETAADEFLSAKLASFLWSPLLSLFRAACYEKSARVEVVFNYGWCLLCRPHLGSIINKALMMVLKSDQLRTHRKNEVCAGSPLQRPQVTAAESPKGTLADLPPQPHCDKRPERQLLQEQA